ncbi:MAG: hypothetical protein N2688_01695 [Burkholderiaceae bacterium]|nr:hypothetical protein [Burkholderiaceae bacterium]
MSEIAVAWIVPQASALLRRLRIAALALTAAVIAVLAARWASVAPLAAAVASGLVAALLWLAGRPPAEPALRFCVDGDGQCWVDLTGGAVAAHAAFVSPLLIVLQAGGRSLPVWRDAVPQTVFRRLSAAARWALRRRRQPAATEQIARV